MTRRVITLWPSVHLQHSVCLKRWVRSSRLQDRIYLNWRWPWERCTG